MKKIIFDIETRNTFEDVGKADPTLLDLSVVCAHDSETGDYLTYTQEELLNLWPILEKPICLSATIQTILIFLF